MILLNGHPATSIDLFDRGLHYGDGLFETLALHEGEPLLWERHMARLEEGCRRLAIPLPDPQRLRGEIESACEGAREGVVKIVVTRGVGGRGYRPPAASDATRIIFVYPPSAYPDEHATHGVTVRLCATRLARNPLLAGIKHLNRLEQVLARAEWSDETIAEGLMLDTAGHVVEGTMSNLFLINADALITPPVDECGVAGVMRAQVMESAAALGIPCTVAAVSLAEVKGAEALFLTNGLFGLWPVRRFEERAFPVPPLVQRLRQQLRQDHACA